MTLAADPTQVVVVTAPVAAPAEMVVVSRDTRNDVLASVDTPLPLAKARRTEDGVLRQAIFVTSTLTVVRPAAGAGEVVLRWTYEPYLQRQLCFTSMTGQFSCTVAEAEALIGKAMGEASLPPTPEKAAPGQAEFPTSAAEPARMVLATSLSARATALFEEDRRLRLTPMLRAAGVSIRRGAASPRSARLAK